MAIYDFPTHFNTTLHNNMLIDNTSYQNNPVFYYQNTQVFKLSHKGEIILNLEQKPTIQKFFKHLQQKLDLDVIEKRVVERFYLSGMERALKLAKNKTHEEFIAELEKEVQARQDKVIFRTLQESE